MTKRFTPTRAHRKAMSEGMKRYWRAVKGDRRGKYKRTRAHRIAMSDALIAYHASQR